jgi:hypothetical protein
VATTEVDGRAVAEARNCSAPTAGLLDGLSRDDLSVTSYGRGRSAGLALSYNAHLKSAE